MARTEVSPDFLPVAEIEIDAVVPGREGFVLDGRGADGADYRLELHLDMPLDQRTRAVLGELLSQSEWTIQRRSGPSGLAALRRERARQRALRQPDSG
jgi:hypothetical protein